MKKISTIYKFLLVLFFCFSINVKAQTINTEWATKINQTFAGIDKNRVPHSLLKDYAMEFTDLSVHPTAAQLNLSSLAAGTYVVMFEYLGQTESYTIIKT